MSDHCEICEQKWQEAQKLREALGAYRSALRSGEPESKQLRAVGDAALGVSPEGEA